MQTRKNSPKYIIAFVGILLLFSSCKKEYESIQSIDDAKIKAYIQKNNITATKDPSGFYYQIVEQGTGGPLLNKDSVLYSYSFNSLIGTTYYKTTEISNEGNYVGYTGHFALPNNQSFTLPSFRDVMILLNRGGKAKIILPSYLAFGKNGAESIGVPSNEILITEISTYIQKSQAELDDKRITDFIAAKGLTGFTKHPSRVYQNISVLGTGTTIGPFSTITVKYKGRLLTGTQFDESGSTDLVQPLNQLVLGWQKVLKGLTKGSKLRILIPSDLGYGTVGKDIIPPNSVLDFDIEVVDVVD